MSMKKFLLKMATKTAVLTDEDRNEILDQVIKNNKKLIKRNKLIQYNLKMQNTDIKTEVKKYMLAPVSSADNLDLEKIGIMNYADTAKWAIYEAIDNLSYRRGIKNYAELSTENKIFVDNMMYDIHAAMCESIKDGNVGHFILKFKENYSKLIFIRVSKIPAHSKNLIEIPFDLNEEVSQFMMNGVITRIKGEVPVFLMPLKYCEEDFSEN